MSGDHSNASSLEGFSGLKRWTIWLVILSVISVIVTLAFLLSGTYQGLINWAMYAVISSLGVGLIIKGFFDARFLQHQTDLASSQIRLLEQVDNFEDFLSKSRPSIFRSHIENLFTISKSHVDISQDNLIELLHTRLLARNKVVELFSSILITLGLIGTILGLILMMDSLTEVMGSAAMDENLMKALVSESGPLSGLGVAFFTTLLGAILGGVVLRVLTSVVDANIMEYTAHIAELTEVHVLPYMRKAAELKQ
jgi:biopolymer transport protein ExbB/TolQ